MLGRDFRAEDDRVGAPPVVILGYDVWKLRYQADPGIIDRVIRVNGVPATVIGVMPQRSAFPRVPNYGSRSRCCAPRCSTIAELNSSRARQVAPGHDHGPGDGRSEWNCRSTFAGLSEHRPPAATGRTVPQRDRRRHAGQRGIPVHDGRRDVCAVYRLCQRRQPPARARRGAIARCPCACRWAPVAGGSSVNCLRKAPSCPPSPVPSDWAFQSSVCACSGAPSWPVARIRRIGSISLLTVGFSRFSRPSALALQSCPASLQPG